jgi:hypothetical protein
VRAGAVVQHCLAADLDLFLLLLQLLLLVLS